MMKVYQKITFLGIFTGFLVIGCVHKNHNIVIGQAKQILDVQQYTDTTSVQYIALETTPECLLGRRINQLLVTDSFIFVVNYQPAAIYMFGRDGEFVRQIGSLGRGPGEYLNVENITVNEDRREITLYDSEICQAMKFDYDGKKITSFSNSYSPYGEIIQLNDTLFALQNSSNNSGIPQNPKILILNDSGEIVNTFIQQPQFAEKK